ncbi:MAG TPA: GNAT family N-acetyltransferase [Opitutaceae bacterium]|jgi:RimJ/RimL family protein N-acetyltransferase
MPTLETDRLSLREIAAADDGFVLELMNEPAYLQHIGDRGVSTVGAARAYIAQKLAPSYAKFGYGLYLVERRPSHEAIGICGFVRRDSLEHPDIGFAFLQRHWSQGFALESARAVLAHGFGPLGMKAILGVVSPGNDASVRLLEKLGFRFQKMHKVPPGGREALLFELQRPEAAPAPGVGGP